MKYCPSLVFFDVIFKAIDNIKLEKKDCSFIPIKAQPSNTSSISCSFDKDTCGWFNDISAKFSWLRHQGTINNPTVYGPYIDHSTGSNDGWYLYISINKHQISIK
jgi:hypothetical protein